MNKLGTKRRAQVVSALVEGNSIRATCRKTETAKNTVSKLLRDLGAVCSACADENIRGLQSERIQLDEIWSYCRAKEKNVPDEHKGEFGWGDVWTWTAIDADSKLMVSWLVGERTAICADAFVQDVADRVDTRPQITMDGLQAYRWAVPGAFRGQVDFAMLQKEYASTEVAPGRYSPPEVVGTTRRRITGDPDPAHVSTSYVERSNLTMRMSMRRFTRLTNGFSKKAEQLEAAVSLHFMHYNYCRPHRSLQGRNQRLTPAQAAGLADHRWTLEELVGLLEKKEAAVSVL